MWVWTGLCTLSGCQRLFELSKVGGDCLELVVDVIAFHFALVGELGELSRIYIAGEEIGDVGGDLACSGEDVDAIQVAHPGEVEYGLVEILGTSPRGREEDNVGFEEGNELEEVP